TRRGGTRRRRPSPARPWRPIRNVTGRPWSCGSAWHAASTARAATTTPSPRLGPPTSCTAACPDTSGSRTPAPSTWPSPTPCRGWAAPPRPASGPPPRTMPAWPPSARTTAAPSRPGRCWRRATPREAPARGRRGRGPRLLAVHPPSPGAGASGEPVGSTGHRRDGRQEAGANPARSRHRDRGVHPCSMPLRAAWEGDGAPRSGSQDTGLSRARPEERGAQEDHVSPLFTPARTRRSPRPPVASRSLRPPRLRAVAVALSAVLLTAGCGASGGGAAGEAKASVPAPKGFPVTVDNCGVRTTYERPPSRVVTIHQHPAELMLALGLKDRMVGTAFPDSEVLPELKADYEAVPELAKREPSFEKVLDVEPDLVYGGYGSAFDEKQGRSRKAFADAGADTHLNREYYGQKRVTMRDT